MNESIVSKTKRAAAVAWSTWLGVKQSCNCINILQYLLLVFCCLVAIPAQGVNQPVELDTAIAFQIPKHGSGSVSNIRNGVLVMDVEVLAGPNMQNDAFKLSHKSEEQALSKFDVSLQEQPMTKITARQSAAKHRHNLEYIYPLVAILGWVIGGLLCELQDRVSHRGMGSRVANLLTPNVES